MLTITKTEVYGWESAMRGMRNPLNSWHKADSIFKDGRVKLGANDYDLAKRLSSGGPTHGKFMRMILVAIDINAPLYWWKEFDTYKVGTVANSCSTMHKLTDKRFEPADFSIEHLTSTLRTEFMLLLTHLNACRKFFIESKDKKWWWQIIQLLPTSYNQKRTVLLNYEVLRNIYGTRKSHKLDEWHTFCDWIESLPYSEFITGETKKSEAGD